MSRFIIPALVIAAVLAVALFAAVIAFDFFPELLAVIAIAGVVGVGAYAFRELS